MLARVDFIEELERVATACSARFVEVALVLDRAEAVTAFEHRRRAPATGTHRDAALLVERSGDPDALGTMYDALAELLDRRPHAHRVRVVRGDLDATVALVEDAIRS